MARYGQDILGLKVGTLLQDGTTDFGEGVAIALGIKPL
jgi:hypothetical protein